MNIQLEKTLSNETNINDLVTMINGDFYFKKLVLLLGANCALVIDKHILLQMCFTDIKAHGRTAMGHITFTLYSDIALRNFPIYPTCTLKVQLVLYRSMHYDIYTTSVTSCFIQQESNCSFVISCIKSLYGWNIAKAAWILKTTNQLQSFFSFVNRHLDLSSKDDQIHQETEACMRYIVQNLPKLQSLDLTGTNLAGVETEQISHRPEAKGDGDQKRWVDRSSAAVPGPNGDQLGRGRDWTDITSSRGQRGWGPDTVSRQVLSCSPWTLQGPTWQGWRLNRYLIVPRPKGMGTRYGE